MSNTPIEPLRHAVELVDDERLGDIARAKNSVDVAFFMLQRGKEALWLPALIRDCERLASEARAMLRQVQP